MKIGTLNRFYEIFGYIHDIEELLEYIEEEGRYDVVVPKNCSDEISPILTILKNLKTKIIEKRDLYYEKSI